MAKNFFTPLHTPHNWVFPGFALKANLNATTYNEGWKLLKQQFNSPGFEMRCSAATYDGNFLVSTYF